MRDKIYCKDCRFCESGLCHRIPPVRVPGCSGSYFPFVNDFYWCDEAERREEVEYADCPRDEIAKMQAEKNNLRRLIAEVGEFLIAGALPGRVHLKHEDIQAIYGIAAEVRGENK